MVVDPTAANGALRQGARLADIAPTVLAYLGIDQPDVMTGRDLIAARVTVAAGGASTRAEE
jgi:bisphosphoglycerate-independent phosphoglycerate mutase (AlkP superfamily)